MTMMTLQAACAVLARRHTVTDELTGFIIDRTFKPGDLRYSELEEYMNAWAVVRHVAEGGTVRLDLGTIIEAREP